ncbi:MAG: PQQ-binding-like beta-propeller repeat protein [Planctomycetes bacterium]|nr:PQQ-binding-like beta-propeller repeat protein [Planctomycetota bacterium]
MTFCSVVRQTLVIAIAVVTGFVQSGIAKDWPQWHGPLRDNISNETGLLKQWPENGPVMLWSIEGMGSGYSTVSIADSAIYITGMIDKQGMLSKIDLDGKLIWQKPYAGEWRGSYPGSRSTPTINDSCAYIMSGVGDVVCIDIETGAKKWSVNTLEKYGGKTTAWGIADSLLIDGEKVFCMAGGPNASIVALNKKTGQLIWATKQLSEKVAFCSPIMVEHQGKKQLISVLVESVVGIDTENGQLLWKLAMESFKNPEGEKRGAGSTANTPIYKDGCFFVTTGYNHGGAKIRISQDSKTATVVWKNFELDNHHGGVVLVDGMLYGSGWTDNQRGDWLCVDFDSGKTMYTHSWDNSKGSVFYAEDMLYCYAEKTGKVALVKADPNQFSIVSSFEVTLGKEEHWTHPVIFDGRLYIRHGDVLMAYDIKKE